LIVVAVAGMPGSGKSTVARVIAEKLGYPVIVMGDLVREEVARRGLAITAENVERVARELRELRGLGVVAEMVVERAGSLKAEGVVVDGVRSLEEVRVLSRLGKVYIVAVHSPPSLRFKRMKERGREGDIRSLEEFRLRDEANLELGVGSVIALADYMVVNDCSLEELILRAERVAGEIRGASKGCSGG